MKNRVFTILLFLLLGACRSHDTIGHYRGMPEETWDRQNTVTFEMQIPDSGAYNRRTMGRTRRRTENSKTTGKQKSHHFAFRQGDI